VGIPSIRYLVLILTLSLVPSSLAHAQVPTLKDIEDQNRRMNLLYGAAELYRAGHTQQAIKTIDELSVAFQLGTSRAVVSSLRLKLAGKDKPENLAPSLRNPKIKAKPWDIARVRWMAALEMEAALRDYRERDASGYTEINHRIEAANVMFAFVAEITGEPDAAAGWELVLALTAFGDGELGWTSTVVYPACRNHPGAAALLLACGSASVVLASQPADRLLLAGYMAGPPDSPFRPRLPEHALTDMFERLPGASTTDLPDVERRHSVESAITYLERALAIEPQNAEARLRLAHARILQRNDGAAVPLLEDLVSERVPADARLRYLARLFLGGIHRRAENFEAAKAVLGPDLDLVPSGQSAFIALADVARERGDIAAALTLIDRMLEAPSRPEDPWLNYFFGQYWVPEPLLDSLREAARR
jgi:tetratricopeptide (TPR) repeat protein